MKYSGHPKEVLSCYREREQNQTVIEEQLENCLDELARCN